MAYRTASARATPEDVLKDHLYLRAGEAPNVDHLVKFNDEERQLTVDMMSRAMLLGESEEIWTFSVAAFQDKRKKLIDQDQWETVCAEFRRRRDLRLTAVTAQTGAMSDGSKRARPSSPAGPAGPPPPQPVRPHGGAPPPGALRGNSSMTTSSVGGGQPLDHVVVATHELPEGVSSLTHWGQTMINFGKMKSRQISYYDLAIDGSESEVNYKEWVMARVQTGSDQLKDLALFLRFLDKNGLLPKKKTDGSSASSVITRAKIEKGPERRADSPSSSVFGPPTPSP